MDKVIQLVEKNNIRGTRVIVKSLKTGKVLDEGSNSILYSGSINGALKDFGVYNPNYTGSYFAGEDKFLNTSNIAIPPSYDVALFGDKVEEDFSAEGVVCLFAIGIDGVEYSTQSSQRKKVQYEGWINPDDMIAFRVTTIGNPLAPSEASKYARHLDKDGNRYYYFKKFEQQPKCFTSWNLSSDDINSAKNYGVTTSQGCKDYYNNVLLGNANESAEVIVQMHCKVTPKEVREWFDVMGYTQPNVSSILICTAIPEYGDDGEILGYKNIQPKSKRHITRELLLEEEKGIEIIYQYLY